MVTWDRENREWEMENMNNKKTNKNKNKVTLVLIQFTETYVSDIGLKCNGHKIVDIKCEISAVLQLHVACQFGFPALLFLLTFLLKNIHLIDSLGHRLCIRAVACDGQSNMSKIFLLISFITHLD